MCLLRNMFSDHSILWGAVVDEAAGAQLTKLADLRVDRGEEQARVGDGAVRDVAGAVVPREADARAGLVAPPRPVERRRALRWQELHDARDRVGCAIADAPARRAVDVVCEKSAGCSDGRRRAGRGTVDFDLLAILEGDLERLRGRHGGV